MSTSDAEIAKLRAQAAQAAAEAAEAKAAAAQAALDAAIAAASAGPEPSQRESSAPEAPKPPAERSDAETPAEQTPAHNGSELVHDSASVEPSPAPAEEATSAPSDYERTIREGYAFATPSLTIGTYLEGGESRPATQVSVPLAMLNRHGLVAGATGTGKTRTLQLLTEGLSSAGVPVFITDIKGDLTGLLEPGVASEKLTARVAALGQNWQGASFPVELFSLGGAGTGVPIRTTVTDFGPILMSKVLGLNETQESALSLIFSWADAEGLALIDLADVRATVAYLTSDEGKDELAGIGGVSKATAGVILREIAQLQAQGADAFFGEPAFETSSFLCTADGKGVISCLELPAVQSQPALFSTFVMWLLASLFQDLPEIGDTERPKLVFFFDEAHLLFSGASKEFLKQVVQTVRLIRSKGVGIFFVTQSPKDVPDDVLAQLGARVQHALRAHTPNEHKALKATVDTYPSSPLDLIELLPSLGTGEAIVTVLDAKGRPTPVAPVRLWAPAAVMGPSSEEAIRACLAASPFMDRYKDPVDPESAFEMLQRRIEEEALAAQREAEEKLAAKQAEEEQKRLLKELEREQREAEKAAQREQREAEKALERARRDEERYRERQEKRREAAVDSVVRSVGRSLGSAITRSIFGSRRR